MQAPPITARPALYIDVHMPNGTKQVLEVSMARAMHEQLGLALASLEPVSEAAENDQQTELPLPDDLDNQDDDDLPLVAGVGHSRHA